MKFQRWEKTDERRAEELRRRLDENHAAQKEMARRVLDLAASLEPGIEERVSALHREEAALLRQMEPLA